MSEKQASSEIAQSREYERCPDCDKPLEPCGSCPQCGEYPDSPCHKAYLAWDGWRGPAPMWDTFRAGWQAAERDTRERVAQELKEVAGEVGSHVAYHIEQMYPGAVKATPKSFLLSVRNFTSNKISWLAERIRGKE